MSIQFRARLVLTAATLLAVPSAHAAGLVRTASDVFVERVEPAAGGGTIRTLERADRLHTGDRVIFVVNWRADTPRDFTLTNPMPATVAFQGSAGGEEVSVDGGRTWGPLGTLTVRDGRGGLRPATSADVTHVRWRVPGARGSGQLTYRGIVR